MLRTGWTLLALTVLSVLLRFLGLGTTFESSDNAELAARILGNEGWRWMAQEHYGVLVYLLAKLLTLFLGALGVTLTELWWKAPVALVGSLQPLLVYAFLRFLKVGSASALWGAACIAILPIHVSQSRYVWGYEALACFTLTLAIWGWASFQSKPGWGRAMLGSTALGLYSITHGNLLPALPCIVAATLLAPGPKRLSYAGSLFHGVWNALRYGLWLVPLLCLPLYRVPVGHGLSKPTQPGFYLDDHFFDFTHNMGLWLTLLLFAATVLAVFWRKTRSPTTLYFVFCSACWLLPFFFMVPRGITVVRGYMLEGTYFCVLTLATVLHRLPASAWPRLHAVLAACCALTLWGTVESTLFRDQLIDPSFVRGERGVRVLDVGTKTAGYLVREFVPDDCTVLALHRSVEPPNLEYYAGRQALAWYDLSLEQTLEKAREHREASCLVLADDGQRGLLEADPAFQLKCVVTAEGKERMWLYGRERITLPVKTAGIEEYNRKFDLAYAPVVR